MSGPTGILQSWRELYTHRALIFTLVTRQLSARYRGSFLGFLWTFLNPILLMLVYALIFSVYMRFDMTGYPVFVFAGLLPWLWFSSSVLEGVNSIIAGGSLVTRVLFPPQILPAVTVLANLANFLLALPILIVFLFVSHIGLHASWTALPLVLAVQLFFSLGVAFLVAALNVHYRDVQHLAANGIVLWFFLTPILYPVTRIPEALRPIQWLNPMAPLMESYQDVLFWGRFPAPDRLLASTGVALMVLVLGTVVMNRFRDSFAEEL